MDLFVTCDVCQSKAVVIGHVHKLSDLEEIALTLGLVDPAESYMIIDCPKCGIRDIEPPSDDPASDD